MIAVGSCWHILLRKTLEPLIIQVASAIHFHVAQFGCVAVLLSLISALNVLKIRNWFQYFRVFFLSLSMFMFSVLIFIL